MDAFTSLSDIIIAPLDDFSMDLHPEVSDPSAPVPDVDSDIPMDSERYNSGTQAAFCTIG